MRPASRNFVDDAAAVLARLARRHKRGALASASGRGSIPLPGGRPIWLPREFADSCIRGRGKPIGIETAIMQMKQIIAASPDSIRVT
jgi:hypothetical protein